jgi:hypothetical protein
VRSLFQLVIDICRTEVALFMSEVRKHVVKICFTAIKLQKERKPDEKEIIFYNISYNDSIMLSPGPGTGPFC